MDVQGDLGGTKHGVENDEVNDVSVTDLGRDFTSNLAHQIDVYRLSDLRRPGRLSDALDKRRMHCDGTQNGHTRSHVDAHGDERINTWNLVEGSRNRRNLSPISGSKCSCAACWAWLSWWSKVIPEGERLIILEHQGSRRKRGRRAVLRLGPGGVLFRVGVK